MSSFTKIAMKFLVDFEKQKKDLMQTHKLEGSKLMSGKGMNFIRQISNPEDQKMKWIQKTLFIELLKKVITRIGSIHLNNILKPEIIKTYLLVQRRYKLKHKGLIVLIELFGDMESQISEYKEQNKNKSLERDDEVDLMSIKSHKIQNHLKNSVRQRKESADRSHKNIINLSVQHQTSKMSPMKQKSMLPTGKEKKFNKELDSDLNVSVMSEFPFGNNLTKNQERLMYQPENISLGKYKLKSKLSKNEERALREIEKVKLRRQRRLEDKLFEEERKQMQQEKLKKEIKIELKKRKVEHGVLGKNKKGFKKDSIIRETSLDRDDNLRKESKIELYDFSLEETKDQNDIKNFLSKYRKLLQFLFKTYANTGYSHKQINTFDQMHDRLESMSLAEAIVMLKKNSIIPDLLHKDEAKTILRLVNSVLLGDKREGKSLTFEAFNSYFLQIAMFVFSKEPINLSQKPPIESVMALLKLFEKSAIKNGESITLFENPDHTILADNEVIKEINKLLRKDPNIPMPDGFKRIKIKEYKSVFKVPDYMPIPEKNKICLEIIDELLAKKFGFHIFEPISQPVYTYKAKPVLKQLMKYPMGKKDVPFVLQKSPGKSKSKSKARFQDPIPTRAYQDEKSAERGNRRNKNNLSVNNKKKRFKSTRSIAGNSGIGSDLSASESTTLRKRVYNDITPQLGLNLRLEVVKYPMHQRDIVQEVAEVLEEVLDAASKGMTALPVRKKYGIKTYNNQVQQLRQKREEEERKKSETEQKNFESHKASLHERLTKMKKEKEKVETERKKIENLKTKKQKEKELKEKEEAKKRIDARKAQEKEKLEEQKRSQSVKKNPTLAERKEKEKRVEFLSKRKAQMRKEFNSLSKQRKGHLTEEEKEERMKIAKKDKNENLKKFFDKQKDLKAHNDAAKKEFLQFYESPKIQSTFENNFDVISEAYLTFAKTQKYTKSVQPVDFQMTFAAFKKFGHDMKIYPKILSFDDFSYVFKMITKEKSQKTKDLKTDEEEKYGEKDNLNITFNEFKDALTRIACLAKYKLGGLSGISDSESKTKENELKNYLKNRWKKGGIGGNAQSRLNRNNTNRKLEDSKNKTLGSSRNLNNSSRNLNAKGKNGLQSQTLQQSKSNTRSKADLNKSETGRYAFEKPKKLSKLEKEKLERERAVNAAKSFSLKNFSKKFMNESSNGLNNPMPAVIYEDSELNTFPEFDTENMTEGTLQVLINFLKDIIAAQKSGDINNVEVKPMAKSKDEAKNKSGKPPVTPSSNA